ncbi:cilia- and flagella-associated protein 298-like [Panicum virgatum]|uniref:Uncharacterized protein n=1 Tax=Panicum virgatum TaxID=38727 RepID=A0A8T0UVU8_PANVG|nr:cilia- and flagella-associated protein 298-like [Panicum virgatum]KAG2624229.1 hypothetical protein PVAP13_3KG114300 [Panicum virgatum]
MVMLHVKSAAAAAAATSSSSSSDADEETEFLYECAASAAVADVAAALGVLAGLQARLLSLCRRLRARCADAGAAAVGELERAIDEAEAEAYASKEQVQHNRFLSPCALREHIKTIEEKCATALQEPTEALDLQESSSDSKHERIQLWWAGKELAMDHKLCDYIGINEKTKIVIKLTRARDDR